MRKVLILLLFSLAANAATYYVSVADGNDTNCTGLASTPYVSGSGQPCPWKTIAKINAATLSAGDMVLFKGGETWTVALHPAASGTEGNYITFGSYNKTAGPATLTAGTYNSWGGAHNYLVYDSLRIGARIWAEKGDSHLHFINCIIENSADYGFYGAVAQTDIQFDHCVFARNTNFHILTAGVTDVTVRNCIFLSNAATDAGPFSIGTGGTLDLDYSLVNTAQTVSITNVVDGGHNLWYPDPKLTAYPTSIIPRFAYTTDDTASLDTFASAMAAMAASGVKGTIFVSPAQMTAGNITTAQTLSAAGHEIANHTLNHEDLTATQAFTVTTTNTNPTVDIDVATTTITLSCDEVANRVALNWSSGLKISDLKTAVAGKGWTITNSAENTKPRQETLLLDELADSAGAQAAPYTALLDISAPNYKFWAHEINDAQDQIQTITGIRPTTMAYPYGFSSAGFIQWLKDTQVTHGLVTARKVSGAPTDLASVPKWTFIQRPYGWSSTDDEATVRAWARRMYFYGIGTPAYFLFYEHATTSAYWTRWAWFADELAKLGAQFPTYGQLAGWIASDHADDGTNWTKTYDVTGGNYRLKSGSPAIGAGTATLATDILGNPYKTNDVGAYAYQGGGANALMFTLVP